MEALDILTVHVNPSFPEHRTSLQSSHVSQALVALREYERPYLRIQRYAPVNEFQEYTILTSSIFCREHDST